MSEDNEEDKKSKERRRSARSPDIAKKVLEEMTARDAKLRQKKDEDPDNSEPDAD